MNYMLLSANPQSHFGQTPEFLYYSHSEENPGSENLTGDKRTHQHDIHSSLLQGLETWKLYERKLPVTNLVLTSAGFFCSFAGVFDLLLYLEQEEKEVEGPVEK